MAAKNISRLLVLFAVLVLLKTGIAFFVQSPSIFSDEYLYMKLARSFFYDQEFSVHQMPFDGYPPLYPMILSVAYFLQEMHLVYAGMKIVNALISSLIIIPLYLLSRTLWNEKEAFLLTIITSMFPGFFAFSPYIMAENLFYPLFLTVIYGMYKCVTDGRMRWFILAGVAFIAAYATRTIAALVLPVFFVLVLRKWAVEKKKRAMLVIIISFIILLGAGVILNLFWDISGGNVHFIERLKGIQPEQVLFFCIWIAGWITYLALSVGIIPLMALTAGWKDKSRRVWILILLGLGVTFAGVLALRAALGGIKVPNLINLPGRPIGRYIDVLAPLVIILGLSLMKKMEKSVYLLCGGIFLVGSVLFFFPLVPVNNIALTWMGVLQYGIKALGLTQIWQLLFGIAIMLLMMAGWQVWKRRVWNVRVMFFGLFLFFILINILASGITVWSAKEWKMQEHAQLGEWIQENNTKHTRVVLDRKYCTVYDPRDTKSVCSPALHTSLLGVWLNSEMAVKEQKDAEEGDFFITKEEAPFILVRKTESGTYLYKKMFSQQP